MNKWIEINLPYYKSAFFDSSHIVYPNLEDRAKKELGFNRRDITNKQTLLPNFSSPEYEIMSTARDEIDIHIEETYEYFSEEYNNARVKAYLDSSIKEINLLGDYNKHRFQYDAWLSKQPEIIAYHKQYKEESDIFYTENNKLSFSGMKLNNPGTLIEVEMDGKLQQFLIGDINCLSGTCDDCLMFDNNITVKRYKIVWSPNDKEIY